MYKNGNFDLQKKGVQLSNKFGKSGILLLGIQLMALRIPAENILHFNSFNIVFQTASIWDIFYPFAKHLLISAKYTVGNIDNTHFTGLGLYFLPILPRSNTRHSPNILLLPDASTHLHMIFPSFLPGRFLFTFKI